MIKFSRRIKKFFIVVLCVVLTLALAVFGVDAYVKSTASKNIITPEQAEKLQNVDCIIVLGCQVHPDGNPSIMLNDRIKRGVELYKLGVSQKIIMSGDHGQAEYDEVNAMKQTAIDLGVDSSDVFMDHAGFSTYETVYRAKEIFGAKRVVIVTQQYHLYRAVYIAKQLGLEAYGVNSDFHEFRGQIFNDVREILARNKDFVKCIFKPEPTYLGETIAINGDGDVTNDK